jgi:hypothetical protein
VIPVIVRSPSGWKAKNPENHPSVELFLPYQRCHRGDITCWDGSTLVDADLEYYRETIPCWGHMAEAELLVKRFKEWCDNPSEIRWIHRLPQDWMDRAWGR